MNRQSQNYGSISAPTVGFSENTSEFNSYCDSVVTNIYTINSSLKTLETALKCIGTKKDNQGLRNSIHVTQLSTNQIASASSRDLNKLKLLVARDKQKQLQVEKLEGNFRDAVNVYYALQKVFEIETAQDEDETRYNQQHQEQVARELEFEQDMLLEREARIKQIESDVLDINQIMRELGAFVHIQGETIDTIENSIDHAAGNVEEGTEQLIKASQYQNKYRRKLLYLVVIGLIIVAILIAVLVSELKR
ncbi:hypothetical protein NQ317_007539 [Molorchus minor]|uniref:t-SNARE coiled-coil homology domain-containing protein n=1 Tax=Molorchus minor TaxID=1323400 RepID=A0ABQ9K5V5_9CUCU|nr:hypothetical protein NQ317_007539 [Molorchus minor]